ncbi:MAG: PilZ domain-containing protein [Desulfovibrio sp.]|nr:MAG: PilZ domain-containing protein [Desulfovibrio sp.]
MTARDDSFDFSFPKEPEHKREAFRASLPGLKAKLAGTDREYAVKDISAAGMALHNPSKRGFRAGDVLALEIILNNKTLLTSVAVTVKRVLDNGLVGCSFVGLSPRQEAHLDKLVLEVQKRLIAVKKAKSRK